MEKYEGIVSFPSLTELDRGAQDDEFLTSDQWSIPKITTLSSSERTSKQDNLYQLSDEPYFDEYDSKNDFYNVPYTKVQPEVNLKNVLSGVAAILTGANRGPGVDHNKDSSSSISFMGSENNGEYFLHSSVCMPSAPPLFETETIDYTAYKEILETDPPEWLPDSCTNICMQCSSPFTALTRGRHHCRFCGAVFCRTCTKRRCLMPIKFRERNPQRVCDSCYDRLEPLQDLFVNSISNAMQSAKHDVLDWTCTRGWLNLPVGLSMEHEIYKASNTLRSYYQVAGLNPDKSIPLAVLKGAKGLAILTVAKVGTLLTYKLGTGLVVSRKSDGSWSAPSAILSAGLGWGAQIGGEITDFIIVLHGSKAVRAFSSRMHCSLGAGLSAAAGPVGRSLEVDLCAGDKGSGMCYTYSCSKGAFIGVSVEGSIVATRRDVNLCFYGDSYLSTTDILLGHVEQPRAAAPLYSALDDLYSSLT